MVKVGPSAKHVRNWKHRVVLENGSLRKDLPPLPRPVGRAEADWKTSDHGDDRGGGPREKHGQAWPGVVIWSQKARGTG